VGARSNRVPPGGVEFEKAKGPLEGVFFNPLTALLAQSSNHASWCLEMAVPPQWPPDGLRKTLRGRCLPGFVVFSSEPVFSVFSVYVSGPILPVTTTQSTFLLHACKHVKRGAGMPLVPTLPLFFVFSPPLCYRVVSLRHWVEVGRKKTIFHRETPGPASTPVGGPLLKNGREFLRIRAFFPPAQVIGPPPAAGQGPMNFQSLT